MATDTELLIKVFMFLGILGAVIFVPWMIYRDRKKLPLKYQRIGCAVSAVLLLCGMYFVLDNSPLTTKKFSREAFVRAMEPSVAEWVGENNYSVNLDGEVVTFIVWDAGASTIFNRLYQGIDDNSDNGWASQVNGIQQSAKTLQELAEQYCFEEMTVMINAVDYSDHSKLLISCSPDAVLFNAADSIAERVEPEVVEVEPESNDFTATTDTDKQETIPNPTDTPKPTDNVEPDPETKAENKIWREKYFIENKARRIVAENYTLTSVDSVSVNENLGTDTDGDYILLVYLIWNQKNSPELTKKVLAMYSADFAAQVGNSLANVSECAVFWTVPYYSLEDTLIKYSYERMDNKMYQSDVLISSLLD